MNNIRLYDFLSFLLPGLLVLLAISFFFSNVIPILPNGIRFQDLGAIGNSIIFLFIAFVIGHVIQVFGNQFELKQIKYWGKLPLRTAKHKDIAKEPRFSEKFISFLSAYFPSFRFIPLIKNRIRKQLGLILNEIGGGWYSRQLLRPEDGTYDLATKKNIRIAAEKILDIEFKESDLQISKDEERKQADFKNQIIFDRAYRLIIQKNSAPQTEDFNSQYGFYRGMCVSFLFVARLAILTSAFYTIKLILVWKHQGILIRFWECFHNLIYGIVAFLILDFLFFIFRRRFERFAFYFANSVYQNFLVWWLSEKNK
jgi:hypothetical protein